LSAVDEIQVATSGTSAMPSRERREVEHADAAVHEIADEEALPVAESASPAARGRRESEDLRPS
jgi:hypothetical protein